MKRRSPEQALHMAVARYLRVALRPPAWFTTFPAGGGGRVRGALLKGMGLRPGMPDLIVFAPNGYVLGIELKTAKGKQSDEQRQVSDDFRAVHQGYAICRSVWDVEVVLREHGIPVHATTFARAA